MKNFAYGFLALACAAAAGSAASAQAATITDASVAGSYGLMIDTWQPDPAAHQAAVVEGITLDGAGHLGGTITVVVGTPGGGIANTSPLTGNYNVNPDGTISIAIDSGPTSVAVPFEIDTTGLPHGGLILRTTTYPDHSVSTGTVSLLTKVPKVYKLANLKGTFAFLANRWTASVSTGAEDWVGTLNFDGKGHVTGAAFKNDGSSVSSPSLSGTYAMDGGAGGNSNGTGTISFTTGQTLAFALTNGGKGFSAVLTAEPGYTTNYVVTVTATKQ